MTYGLYRDTQRPGKLTIQVNGNVVAENVGMKTADFDQTFDITEHLHSKPGGFQTAHDIEIACAEGQGEVLITFDVVELILPFSWKQP